MKKLPKMYTSLAKWWPVLSAPKDYEEEAEVFSRILKKHKPQVKTMLELGSGGGNNAFFMKKNFNITLTDLSAEMIKVSKALNPECEHFQGDMRTIRLNRLYDAIFVHDAISYITSEKDLISVFQTIKAHLKKGGIALIVPDWTTETFVPYTDHGGHDYGNRSLRYLEWVYDPNRNDTTYNVEFVIVTKEDGKTKVTRDTHTDGIFSKRTWLNNFENAGFIASAQKDSVDPRRTLFKGVKK